MASRLVKRTRTEPGKADKDPLRRLRQNYPRRSTQPVPMAAAVTAWLDGARKLGKSRRARMNAAFQVALTEIDGLADAADHAAVGSIDKGGTVHIQVDSSTLAHELGVVYKAVLLAKMRQFLNGTDTLAGIKVTASRGKQV